MKTINGGSEPQEPATKRARLESVIPVCASPSTAAKAAPPAAAGAEAGTAAAVVIRSSAGEPARF
jgi:hypothetical protein